MFISGRSTTSSPLSWQGKLPEMPAHPSVFPLYPGTGCFRLLPVIRDDDGPRNAFTGFSNSWLRISLNQQSNQWTPINRQHTSSSQHRTMPMPSQRTRSTATNQTAVPLHPGQQRSDGGMAATLLWQLSLQCVPPPASSINGRTSA